MKKNNTLALYFHPYQDKAVEDRWMERYLLSFFEGSAEWYTEQNLWIFSGEVANQNLLSTRPECMWKRVHLSKMT